MTRTGPCLWVRYHIYLQPNVKKTTNNWTWQISCIFQSKIQKKANFFHANVDWNCSPFENGISNNHMQTGLLFSMTTNRNVPRINCVFCTTNMLWNKSKSIFYTNANKIIHRKMTTIDSFFYDDLFPWIIHVVEIVS